MFHGPRTACSGRRRGRLGRLAASPHRLAHCGLPQDKTAGSRIPPSLWRLAVRLVQTYGICRTATVLGLNYHRLQKHVEAAARTQPPSSEPAFVELPAPALFGKQCVFELANDAGATMRVQLTGYDAADIAALSRSFWSAP